MKGIVWLASYPKSGNTWFRAFLANLLHGGDAPLDINQLQQHDGGRFQFAGRINFDSALGWETSDLTPNEVFEARLAVQEVYAREDNLILKVHEAFSTSTGQPLFSIPATRAALYFLRNPLDVAVSFSHQAGSSVDAIIARMNNPRAVNTDASGGDMKGLLPQPMGTWSHHVRSWVEAPGLPVHVLRYEDMLARPQEVFTAACRFAGFPYDPDRVARALAHSSFDTLRQQEQAKGFREALGGRTFFRKGQAGSWREVLSPAQVSAIVQTHDEVMRRFGYLDADGSLPGN